MITKKTFKIDGMHCSSCSLTIDGALEDMAGVISSSTNYAKQQTDVTYDNTKITEEKIVGVIKKVGYVVGQAEMSHTEQVSHSSSGYMPLYIIFSLIFIATMAVSLRDFYIGTFMLGIAVSSFMAGFFLVFSGFKLLNISGFAEGYSQYDIIAKRFKLYGYVYPFLELLLGLLYLTGFVPVFTNLFTVVLMSISSIGVIQMLQKKQKIQCVCLGTIINVPLSTITLVEDVGMGLMALFMLLS